ncbi:MAG: DivIVA domain-containing protein [Limnochordaceae bacterium]|nr:DivIVA domain-containing protein [Limnochordaceae bacterium]
MLTPRDIHEAEFHTGFRGYNEQEVDDFLSRVVVDYEALFQENRALKDEVADLRQRLATYQQNEAQVAAMLQQTQALAEDLKAGVERHARLLLESARQRAENMVKEAEEQAVARRRATDQQAETILAQARAQVAEAQRQLALLFQTWQSQLLLLIDQGATYRQYMGQITRSIQDLVETMRTQEQTVRRDLESLRLEDLIPNRLPVSQPETAAVADRQAGVGEALEAVPHGSGAEITEAAESAETAGPAGDGNGTDGTDTITGASTATGAGMQAGPAVAGDRRSAADRLD